MDRHHERLSEKGGTKKIRGLASQTERRKVFLEKILLSQPSLSYARKNFKQTTKAALSTRLQTFKLRNAAVFHLQPTILTSAYTMQTNE
jgi:hypothetical protein